MLARALSLVLVLATVLFAVGVIAERSTNDDHHPAAAGQADETESAEPGGHAERGEKEAEHEEPAAETAESSGHGDEEEEERLLGIDLESTPLVILAVLAGLALAAIPATYLRTSARLLAVIVIAAVAWAALDIREVAHQLDESNDDIAAIAIAVALLHLAAAALAIRLARQAGAQAGDGQPAVP